MAKALEGEWSLEQKIDGIDALGEISTLYVPEDVDQIAMLYHFYNDGTGWKEFHVLYEGEVESIIVSRYESKFNYTVDAQGKVSVNFTDAEGIANGKHAELKFDGAKLTDKIEDIDAELQRATDVQIKKYQDEADKWHGGAEHPSYCDAVYFSENEITATGGENAAGIGAGYGIVESVPTRTFKGSSVCSLVVVKGGSVKAVGGANCPGMGISCNDKASSDPFQIGSRCDIIRITAAA